MSDENVEVTWSFRGFPSPQAFELWKAAGMNDKIGQVPPGFLDQRQNQARHVVYKHVMNDRLARNHPTFGIDEVYLVWFCKTLENWKALVITSLPDGKYYEVIHDGAKGETYLDVYEKTENIVIPD